MFDENGALKVDELAKELSTSMFEDQRYKRVDEMKKKAITTSQNYDEFKNLVACASDMLEPVSSTELRELGVSVTGWKHKTPVSSRSSSKLSERTLKTSDDVPTTSLDFDKQWRRTSDRREYLVKLGVATLGPLWAHELDPSVLSQLLDVVLDLDDCQRWVEALVASRSFDLNVMFLDDIQKAKVRDKCPSLASHLT